MIAFELIFASSSLSAIVVFSFPFGILENSPVFALSRRSLISLRRTSLPSCEMMCFSVVLLIAVGVDFMMFLTVETMDLGDCEWILWILVTESDLDVVICESTFSVRMD